VSNNDSLGPIMIADMSVFAINDALRQIGDRIDDSKGLRGRAQIFDRTQVSDPVIGTDAVNLDTATGVIVTLDTDQTVVGTKSFTLPVRMIDANGFLIHSFGTLV
jgi:hypothetical protein